MDDQEAKTRITRNAGAGPQPPSGGHDSLVYIYPPGPNLGRRYILDKPYVSIGRDAENAVVLDFDSVSRRHARIGVLNGVRVIYDLGSTNGTYINDHQVRQHTLRNGDQIKIGDAIFKYLTGDDMEQAYHEEIYRMTIVDGLTSLHNKRYFLEALERELARARRYRRALSLLIFDIDHFKGVNDTYGHLAGDQVLKDLAGLVAARTRREEIVARYGGEEFCVLLPETERKGAVELAEQLRAKVEQQTFQFEEQVIPVTISIGVASLEGRDWDATAFIKAADEQLYLAKRGGRNRVSSAG